MWRRLEEFGTGLFFFFLEYRCKRFNSRKTRTHAQAHSMMLNIEIEYDIFDSISLRYLKIRKQKNHGVRVCLSLCIINSIVMMFAKYMKLLLELCRKITEILAGAKKEDRKDFATLVLPRRSVTGTRALT